MKLLRASGGPLLDGICQEFYSLRHFRLSIIGNFLPFSITQTTGGIAKRFTLPGIPNVLKRL
jgi:hypothetical protein